MKLGKVELELEDAKNEKQAGQEVGLITSASITGTGQGRYRPSSSSEQEHDWFMEHFKLNTMEPRAGSVWSPSQDSNSINDTNT